MPSTPTPVHVALDHPETGRVTIFWDDGQDTVYALAELRKVCPCATCRDIKRQQEQSDGLLLLTTETLTPSTEVVAVNQVGRYALQFVWKDGHSTGIYTYEFLRGFRAP